MNFRLAEADRGKPGGVAHGHRRLGPRLSDRASRPIATISRSAAASTASISWCCAPTTGEETPHPVRGSELQRLLHRQSGIRAGQPIALGYSSMVTPTTIYDYHPESGELEVRKVQEIPSGYDASQYATERLMVAARDGAKVPVSVVYQKGFEKNGEGKLFLYAYGAYGHRHPAGVQHQPDQPARPRLGLRHRPHPRRRRPWLPVVPRRQARPSGPTRSTTSSTSRRG